MKKNALFFLLTTIFVSCNTLHFKTPCGMKHLVSTDEFGKNPVCIIDNTCDEKQAEIKPIGECNNVIGVKPDYEQVLGDYFSDKILRLEKCLYSKSKCE